jgi:DNA-binding sugar fermentation-stimulating protein
MKTKIDPHFLFLQQNQINYNKMMLLKIENLVLGQIVKRPSKHIKSPYVADVKLGEEEILGHAPALGCCGLSDAGATILMSPSASEKCSHTIYFSVHKDQIVGIHPKLAEKLAESALTNNCLTSLQNIKSYRRETKIDDSRFDFTGVDANNIPFIMEVKNVSLTGIGIQSRVAIFPVGNRKKSKDPISPRAIKHTRALTLLRKDKENIRCIMCYVIQRTDVDAFQASDLDPEYKESVRLAHEAGVEIITMVVEWNCDGEAHFVRDNLPFIL